MAYDTLLIEREDGIAVLTVNRPEALNALSPATVAELQHCLTAIRQDASVRSAVITGAGTRAFVAGADIAAMAGMSAVQAHAFARAGQSVMRQIEDLPVPVIAAVNGFALGGGLELALACDLILASAAAKFGQPEINLGLIPGFGGTQRLTRRVGVGTARWLIYGGAPIDSAEALRVGLVERVVAPAELLPEAKRLAAALGAKAPIALQQAKAAINVGTEVDLDNGSRYEAEAFAMTFRTADRAEGMRAFLEKRPPQFKGE